MTIKKIGEISIKCPKCGGDQFVHPDNPDLESQITCTACGETGIARDFAAPDALKAAQRLAIETLRASFRK